jgi:hypothetical protein
MIQVIFKLDRRTFEQAARYEQVMRPPDFFVGWGGGGEEDTSRIKYDRPAPSCYEFLINSKDCTRCCLFTMGYHIQ